MTKIGIGELSRQAVEHSLPGLISQELRNLLVSGCHRVTVARTVAMKYLNRLITSFPSLMCDPPLVYAILEVLTLLRKACEGEYTDEVHNYIVHMSIRLDLLALFSSIRSIIIIRSWPISVWSYPIPIEQGMKYSLVCSLMQPTGLAVP